MVATTIVSIGYLIYYYQVLDIQQARAGEKHPWFKHQENCQVYKGRITTFETNFLHSRYHLGTVAFGSLLLALIQFLRVVVEYVNDRINNLQSNNKLLKSIIWFLRGCFFVLEKLIRYLNRNAYIMTAMVGSGFCRASQDAFTLITSNILRGFFVHQVADFVILLGKAFVVGLTTLFFSMSVSGREDELHFRFVLLVNELHINENYFQLHPHPPNHAWLLHGCFILPGRLLSGS